jgi:hypothetical protein
MKIILVWSKLSQNYTFLDRYDKTNDAESRKVYTYDNMRRVCGFEKQDPKGVVIWWFWPYECSYIKFTLSIHQLDEPFLGGKAILDIKWKSNSKLHFLLSYVSVQQS